MLDVEADRPADRRLQHRRRLLDHRWRARRGQAGRAQFLRHRQRTSSRPSPTANMRAASICRLRAVFSRHQGLGRASSCSAGRPMTSPTSPMAAVPTARKLQFGTPITEAARRAVALLHLQPEHHACRPTSLACSAVAADPAGRGCSRSRLGLRRRQHRDLQHAGQYQEPDQRHQVAAQPGSGRPRRRRKIPAHHRRRALLPLDQQRSGRHGRARKAATSPAGAASRCR